MHPFRAACRSGLARIRAEGRYRTFTPLRKQADRFPVFTTTAPDGLTRDITVWSSNDYLAMGVHPAVVQAATHAAVTMGAGGGGLYDKPATSPAPATSMTRSKPNSPPCTTNPPPCSSPPATSPTRPRSPPCCAACPTGTSSRMPKTTTP